MFDLLNVVGGAFHEVTFKKLDEVTSSRPKRGMGRVPVMDSFISNMSEEDDYKPVKGMALTL